MMMDEQSFLAFRQDSGSAAVMPKVKWNHSRPPPDEEQMQTERHKHSDGARGHAAPPVNTDWLSVLVNARCCFHSVFSHTPSLLSPK